MQWIERRDFAVMISSFFFQNATLILPISYSDFNTSLSITQEKDINEK